MTVLGLGERWDTKEVSAVFGMARFSSQWLRGYPRGIVQVSYSSLEDLRRLSHMLDMLTIAAATLLANILLTATGLSKAACYWIGWQLAFLATYGLLSAPRPRFLGWMFQRTIFITGVCLTFFTLPALLSAIMPSSAAYAVSIGVFLLLYITWLYHGRNQNMHIEGE